MSSLLPFLASWLYGYSYLSSETKGNYNDGQREQTCSKRTCGIITENFSWNWIFYVNVPLGIIEELRGYSTLQAGLLLTPLALTIAVVAPFSGALADRIGTRWLASAGQAIACAGLVGVREPVERAKLHFRYHLAFSLHWSGADIIPVAQ